MNSRDKLILTFVLALLVGAAVAYGLREETEEPTPTVARPDNNAAVEATDDIAIDPGLVPEHIMQRAEKLKEMEEDIPSEMKQTARYLQQRWGHMEDSGLVAPGVAGEGQMYFMDRKVLVGRRANGRPAYARGIIRPVKFDGYTIHQGDTEGLVKQNFALEAPLDENGNAGFGDLQDAILKHKRTDNVTGNGGLSDAPNQMSGTFGRRPGKKNKGAGANVGGN